MRETMQRLAREQADTPREGQQSQSRAGHEPTVVVPPVTAESIHIVLERLARLEGFVSAQQNNWPGAQGTVHHPTDGANVIRSQAEQYQPKTPSPDEQIKKLLVNEAVGIAMTVRRLQQETANIFKLERDATISEFKKYRVQTNADMIKVSRAIETCHLMVDRCNKMILQCLKLAGQFGGNYQMAGETINDAAQTAAGQVKAAASASTKAMEEARQRVLASYHYLTYACRRPAWTMAVVLLSGILLGVIICEWTAGRLISRFSAPTHEAAEKDR